MTFVQARHYRRMGSRSIDLVIAHSMENDEKPGTALNIAKWFAGPTAPIASAHSCVDDKDAIGCVRDQDIAYAAPGANHNGFQIEHAGRARQSRNEWLDTYSLNCLKKSAPEAARIVKAHRLPLSFVRAPELRNGARGVTTHHEVSQAFRQSTHWDPGPGFPTDVWLKLIDEAIHGVPAVESRKADNLMEYRTIECPTGGYWVLKTTDGGVGNYDGAPFFGAIPGVDPDGIESPAVDLAPYVRGGQVVGYWIVLANGQVYGFGDRIPYKGNYKAEWGNRVIVGIRQAGEGYTLLAREAADPPFVLDKYTP